MLPATVAEVGVIALAVPEVTVGKVLTPAPVTATLKEGAPPPLTGIFPE